MENTDILTRVEKLDNLRTILKEMGDVAIAFSGGVDSTFLAYFAVETLGASHVMGLTALAPNFAADEVEYACTAAKKLGIHHECLEVELPRLFWDNTNNRCYHCKKAVLSQLMGLLDMDDITPVLCDGQNKDDDSDYRPGSIAARELNVRSPLNEAGLTKAEIRETLREMNVDIWDKPAFACLASRIPYETTITIEKLRTIYDLEVMLRENGFTQTRARLHERIVRIEILPEEMATLVSNRELCSNLHALAHSRGFDYVTMDIIGYKMGNLNSAILQPELS